MVVAEEVTAKRPFFAVADIKARAHRNGMDDIGSKAIATKLKKEFGMSYRKARVISHHTNAPKNLILRQMWAIKFLQLLESDVELWNVDQSAITSMQVTKRGWFGKGESGNVSGKQLRARINLTVAISTRGRCAYSMHFEKNNTPAVVLFFKYLFLLLEKEDVDFAKKTIWLLDNAPIHKSELFLRWASNQPVKFAFLSTYSWTLAPVEKAFAHIKTQRYPIEEEDIK